MATAMKRLGVYLGLVEDEPGYDGYDNGQDGRGFGYSDSGSSSASAALATATQSLEPVDLRKPARSPAVAPVDPYSIHTIHPRSYNDARRIGEEFRAGSPVIMNLTEMDDSDAKRIVDFAAGLVFAMRGSIERVTQKVFLLSPANVDVRDAPAVRQARDGFFNQS
ncbi:MAG: cell division protein SepF [Candidatus Nanopelagicales bacterium]|nr:cell division protein SepF [Candidatus Nanopelagicales bacterium]MDZ4248512.1 cell division protein SepF [Candidatus Nanopelagicales bacterium]MDZ7577888.1 cell division protein SepF [Candidatus Nanopelagicales bacterium]